MKNLLFTLLLLFSFQMNLLAQCNTYYNFKEGGKFEMETFNGKDKKTGKITNHVKSLSEGSDRYEAVIETKTFDQKDKEQSTGEYTISCNNGVVSIDLKSLIPQESLKAYENMDVVFTGENIEIPTSLKIGDKLKDGVLKGVVKDKSSNTTFSTFDFTITDRVVEGKETITTPAGTFDCFKISYNMLFNTNMMGINMPFHMKGKEYVAKEVGSVRSETYNKNDKLTGYTLLTKRN